MQSPSVGIGAGVVINSVRRRRDSSTPPTGTVTLSSVDYILQVSFATSYDPVFLATGNSFINGMFFDTAFVNPAGEGAGNESIPVDVSIVGGWPVTVQGQLVLDDGINNVEIMSDAVTCVQPCLSNNEKINWFEDPLTPGTSYGSYSGETLGGWYWFKITDASRTVTFTELLGSSWNMTIHENNAGEPGSPTAVTGTGSCSGTLSPGEYFLVITPPDTEPSTIRLVVS